MRTSIAPAAAFGVGAFAANSALNLAFRHYDVLGSTVPTLVAESLITALIVALLMTAGALLGFGLRRGASISVRNASVVGVVVAAPVRLLLDLTSKHVSLLHGPVYVAALVTLSALVAAIAGEGLRARQPHG